MVSPPVQSCEEAGLVRFPLFLEAVTVAAEVDDRATMQEAVHGCRGHNGIVDEDLAPNR